MPPRASCLSAPGALLYALFATLAALCLFNSYIVGKSEGLDGAINYGAYNDLSAITIAISENRYGFHEGYVGRPEVMDALAQKITPGGLMEANSLNEFTAHHTPALEAGLQAASTLDTTHFKRYRALRLPFVVMIGEDTGLVNFYRLSFALFGYHADAMYNCYFLLLAASSLLFLVQARSEVWFAGLLVAMLYGFNGLFYIDSFIAPGAPSVTSNRLIGTLAVVSTLHLMLFLRMRSRYGTLTDWLAALLQIVLLLFVITIRSSTTWQWMLLLVWLALPIAWYWRKGIAWIWQRKAAAIMLIGVLFYTQDVTHRERMDAHDDIYFSDCTMPHHLRWHSAYLAFDMHPDWPEIAPAEANGEITGDGLAWNVARAWWKRRHGDESYSCHALPGLPPFGVHDDIMRKLFFKFAGKHPRFIAELYSYYKPRAIFTKLKASMALLPPWWWRYAGFGAVLMAAMGFFSGAAGRKNRAPLGLASAAIALLFIASNMPAMFAYPSYLAESMMLLLAATVFLPSALAAGLGNLLGYTLRKILRRAPAEIR